MNELWLYTLGTQYLPYKIVKDGKRIYYPNGLFEQLSSGETVLYYRVKEDGKRVERTLKIEKIYINKENVWTIEGEFGERRWNANYVVNQWINTKSYLKDEWLILGNVRFVDLCCKGITWELKNRVIPMQGVFTKTKKV